jgi:N-carbamoyl-L-amino-acid hydrolase
MTNLQINPHRLKQDFDALAHIGATQGGGVNRPALGEAHLAARAWFRQQSIKAGLEFHIDRAGNHSARLICGGAGAPTLLLGSHLDSVLDGGRFDGALGVIAALEVLRSVQAAGLRLAVNLEAIDFTDEEGTLVGLLGSAALAGMLHASDLEKPRGGRQALLDGLARAGLSKSGLLAARRDPASLAGYLELHIEQGPRLYKAGAAIGVVTAIVGICSYHLRFLGRADHAGTTPMEDRLDASQGASAFILAARQLVLERFPGCVVNVGAAQFAPGAFNIVPARAELSLELRSADPDEFACLETALLEKAQAAAVHYGLKLEVEFLNRHAPAQMSPGVQLAIHAAAEALGLSHISLPSGAGHDAQCLASLCPAGMIFVPSREGRSHSALEFTAWEDCLNGAEVLLGAALRIAIEGGNAPVIGNMTPAYS